MNRVWIGLLLAACSTGNTDSSPAEVAPMTPPAHPGPPPEAIEAPPGEFDLVGERADAPKSILIISWDTVRHDMSGVDENPGIQALQAQGTTFTKAMTHFPETGISHWSLMTGVLPEVHGNVPGSGGSRYRGPTLAEIAKKMGYATGAFIGGITLTDQATGLGRGFDVYDDRWDWMRKDVRPGAELVERATSWMNDQETPFFAFVHFFEAHHPYESKPGFEQAPAEGPRPPEVEQQVAHYKSEIAYLDSLLPALLSSAGDDAVVVLTSDHGESFEHDYLYNHRESLWESTLHIPMVVRGPGLEPGSRSDRLVALTDVLPTVLELAGLPMETKIQGQSMLREPSTREFVFAMTDPWSGGKKMFAVRADPLKAIWGVEDTPIAFDLSQDPDEVRPLGSLPTALSEARAAYRSLLAASEAIQHPERPSRFRPDEELKRLESLGYLGSPPASGGPSRPEGPPPRQ